MSIKVQSYVWEHSKAEGSALLLLLAIADFAHDDGSGAFPSVDTLAKKCRQTPRNTQILLRKLEASGELITDPQASPYGTNLYTIPMHEQVKTTAQGGENFSGVKNSAQGGEKQRADGVKNSAQNTHKISPYPLSKSSNEPLVESAPPTDFEKVWREVESVFIVMNPADYMNLRDVWEKFPDFERHNYAIQRARQANPRQFRFYLKDFVSFDPNAPRTWGQALTPSAVPNGANVGTLANAPPVNAMFLQMSGIGEETVGETLARLLQAGKIKKENYDASIQRYSAQLETVTAEFTGTTERQSD